MPFTVEAGQLKRLHPFAPTLKANRECPPDYREPRLWVLWVGDVPTEAKIFFCRDVTLDGGVYTAYAPDAPISRELCGQKVTVDAYLVTRGRVHFTTEDEPEHLISSPRHWSEAASPVDVEAGPLVIPTRGGG